MYARIMRILVRERCARMRFDLGSFRGSDISVCVRDARLDIPGGKVEFFSVLCVPETMVRFVVAVAGSSVMGHAGNADFPGFAGSAEGSESRLSVG